MVADDADLLGSIAEVFEALEESWNTELETLGRIAAAADNPLSH